MGQMAKSHLFSLCSPSCFCFAFSSLGLAHTFKFYHLFYSVFQNRRGNLLVDGVAKEWSAHLLQIFPQLYLRHQ